MEIISCSAAIQINVIFDKISKLPHALRITPSDNLSNFPINIITTSARMEQLKYQQKLMQLDRENQELRRQLGIAPGQHIPGGNMQANAQNINMSPEEFQKLVEYNAHLEREATEYQNKILRQFEEYRLLTESQPECEFKQRYFKLLKKSQRR